MDSMAAPSITASRGDYHSDGQKQFRVLQLRETNRIPSWMDMP